MLQKYLTSFPFYTVMYYRYKFLMVQMNNKNAHIRKSNKEELTMYLILLLGVASIVSLFAVNVLLIDKIMSDTINENQLLRNMVVLEG
jgi:hypothetical protein